MQEAGLNALCVAATYHYGWFLHPGNARHRAFGTEGDVAYFRPNKQYYAKTALFPQMSELCASTDPLRDVERQSAGRFQLVAWVVGAHNTTIGLAHPELTVRNVYGDRLPHALCPIQAVVAEYLKALCKDLAHHRGFAAIQLEAFTWMPFAHGHHHERDLVGLTALEQELMGLCFCPACLSSAKAAGIDAASVRDGVKKILDAAFRDAPERSKGHPQTRAAAEKIVPNLAAFHHWRRAAINQLIREIKHESLAGTGCKLYLQTEWDADLAGDVDGFACASFQLNACETLRSCQAAWKMTPSHWAGLGQCFVQLGMGTPATRDELRGIIQAVAGGGCNGISFYNYSEAPPKMLSWLARTLREFAE